MKFEWMSFQGFRTYLPIFFLKYITKYLSGLNHHDLDQAVTRDELMSAHIHNINVVFALQASSLTLHKIKSQILQDQAIIRFPMNLSSDLSKSKKVASPIQSSILGHWGRGVLEPARECWVKVLVT